MKLFDEPYCRGEETIDNLGDGYSIIQSFGEFRFGTDAVKLSDFANIKPGDRVMDLCTGTGIIPLLLHKKEPKVHIVGLELQPQMCDMAQRSVKLNNLTSYIEIICGDVRQVREQFTAESFQVVTCNPPYMKNATGKQNRADCVTMARHEVCCNLEDCVAAASYLLPSGGRFYMVHRPERLTDIMTVMRTYNVEPKRLSLYASGGKPPRLLVVEGQKNRNSGLLVEFQIGDMV
ncbi:MAG: tRNA1(Val) (adenine(37)-N6)-methyltransferase [Ruminococcaceae bacterium]|nr:tRNA1(Val) (adenine(37)-N6)-methyltransferase [Oscillospiraceae bacterium]